jgi:alpha-ribazole phosphatase
MSKIHQPKTIYLLRHGNVEGDDVCRGQGCDFALSADGLRQTLDNVRFLVQRQVELILTSGLKRTDDAGRLAAGVGIHHEVDLRLNDIDGGDWEGKDWPSIRSQWPDALRQVEFGLEDLERLPGARESIPELRMRVLAAFYDALRRPQKRIALVSHRGPNNIILNEIEPPEHYILKEGQRTACINTIERRTSGELVIIGRNEMYDDLEDQNVA